MRPGFFVLGCALALGCAESSTPKSSSTAADTDVTRPDITQPNTAPPAVRAPQPKARPANPLVQVRKNHRGEVRTWTEQAGVQVLDERYDAVYQAEGQTHLSVLIDIQIGAAPCVVRWAAELLDADGALVLRVKGERAGAANQAVQLSWVEAVPAEAAAKVDSFETRYMTRCGPELARYPSAAQIEVGEAKSEVKALLGGQIEVAAVPLTAHFKGPRCTFELVREDHDEVGFTLQRHTMPFNLEGGERGVARIFRRTAGTVDLDAELKARLHGTRIYARRLSCLAPFDAVEAQKDIEGLKLGPITFERFESATVKSAELELRDYFTIAMPIQSTLDHDCVFDVGYVVLDKAGYPLGGGGLVDRLHLPAGAKLNYVAARPVFGILPEQRAQLGQVVVRRARPGDCTRFNAARIPNTRLPNTPAQP